MSDVAAREKQIEEERVVRAVDTSDPFCVDVKVAFVSDYILCALDQNVFFVRARGPTYIHFPGVAHVSLPCSYSLYQPPLFVGHELIFGVPVCDGLVHEVHFCNGQVQKLAELLILTQQSARFLDVPFFYF